MSGLMNSFYYGKAGKADFTPENLPTNRVQLFFEMLRVRFSGLFGVNFLYLVFCIPAILWTYINYTMMMAGLNPELGISIDFVQDGLLMLYLVGMVPCLTIAGVGACGSMYVLRNWARDQHSFVFSDFKDAVKANWKQGLVVGLINGFSLLLTYVCYTFYGQMTAQSVFWVIPQTLVVVLCVFWWMMQMIAFPMLVTYDMKLSQVLRNCAIITVARLPLSFLFLLGSFGIPVAVALLVPYGYLVMILLFLLLGFSLVGLIYASYANSCFDRFLNPRIEGASVNMGLRDPMYDELDEDEEENGEENSQIPRENDPQS